MILKIKSGAGWAYFEVEHIKSFPERVKEVQDEDGFEFRLDTGTIGQSIEPMDIFSGDTISSNLGKGTYHAAFIVGPRTGYVIWQTSAFLLNNDGKTIERI
jgi:hypothetical protein